jgi:hypothetical protein
MDNLTYNYTSGKNQLLYVDDAVPQGRYDNDIDDQAPNNYSYDEIGNLVADVAEEIDQINWFVNGKIKAIIKGRNQSSKPNLYFRLRARWATCAQACGGRCRHRQQLAKHGTYS